MYTREQTSPGLSLPIGSTFRKMNVTSGSLVYSGTANVVSVDVAKGAGLFGGTYTVNDMTSRMADGFSDSATGLLTNHGTIGAFSKDTAMTVNGDLVSDGVLSAYAGGSAGHITVSGSADVNGSTAAATNALPDESLTLLDAGAITGTLTNPDSRGPGQ